MAIKRKDLTGDAAAYVNATEAAENRTRAKRNKFGNKRTYSDIVGRNFASNGERKMGEWLWAMQLDGEISALKFQPRVSILGCVTMVPDFRYVEDAQVIHHEFKGFATDRWRLQKKIWGLVGPTEYRVSRARQLWPAGEIIRPKPSDELLRLALIEWQRQGYGDKTVEALLSELDIAKEAGR